MLEKALLGVDVQMYYSTVQSTVVRVHNREGDKVTIRPRAETKTIKRLGTIIIIL